MNRIDEDVRDVITNALAEAGIDARNLDVEIKGDCAVVAGTVPSEDERSRLLALLDAVAPAVGGVATRIDVLAAPPSDSADGRGRSPVTGTSADSRHESRHQLDVE